ncbi:MAG: hypothetical protein ACRDLV_09775 [Solirubrobacteraceae bacterium]
MRAGIRINAGAGAVDSRLRRPAAPAGYNYGSAGPDAAPGAWPMAPASIAAEPEVTALVLLTVAELAAYSLCRLVFFRRYHGG